MELVNMEEQLDSCQNKGLHFIECFCSSRKEFEEISIVVMIHGYWKYLCILVANKKQKYSM